MRGFIGGLAIGLVTLALAIVAFTLLSPAPRHPNVSVQAPQPASGAEPSDTASGVSAPGSDGDLVDLPPTAPGAQENGQGDLNSLAGTDTKPADKPDVAEVTTRLADPADVQQAPGVAVSPVPTSPVSTSPVSTSPVPAPKAPGTPQDDSQPATVNNPAQPSLPAVETSGTGLRSGPATEDTPPEVTTAADPSPSSDGAVAVGPASDGEQDPDPSTQTAAVPAAQSKPTSETISAPVPETATDRALQASTREPSAPQITATPAQPPAPVQSPVPDVDQSTLQEPNTPDDSQEPSGPQVSTLPQAGGESGSSRPGLGKPVVPLTQRDDVPDTSEQPSGAEVAAATGPKIEVNGEPFENPDDRPLMSIVLIDDDAGLGSEALAEFPYPLTFAVDPSDPQAAQKMARYRAAGFEVVALVDLPGDATAQDAEVTLSVWLDELPQVVALLEGTGSGVQGNRALSDQVTAIVTSAGMGMIMQAKGLNTAYKLAARDGMPSALVFRDFDGAGQSPDVIRRFLDQAAFRAGQQGGVVMMGRLRADTISALLIWGLQDRASRVALAPVSAVLTR